MLQICYRLVRSALALRRSYDDFGQTSFKPVATVAGGGKKYVTGIEVTGFSVRKQSSGKSLGQAGQHGLGGWIQHVLDLAS
jgi:hypothetical protein